MKKPKDRKDGSKLEKFKQAEYQATRPAAITISIPAETLARIRLAAEREDRSVSNMIACLVRDALGSR